MKRWCRGPIAARRRAITLGLLVGCLVSATSVQASGDAPFGVTPGDELEISRGRSFARVVNSADPTEVVTLAGVGLRAGGEAVSRCAMEPGCLRRRAESSAGRFSVVPKVADLEGLHLDPRDLEELRRCRVGKCDLRLPEEAIRTFERELDWSSPQAEARANTLFRAFLVERASAYLAHGHVGLQPYADRLDGVNLAAGMELILRRSIPGLDQAPEVREYLEKAPSGPSTVLDEHLAWHREHMYRKSVVSLEHVVVVRRDEPGRRADSGDLEETLLEPLPRSRGGSHGVREASKRGRRPPRRRGPLTDGHPSIGLQLARAHSAAQIGQRAGRI